MQQAEILPADMKVLMNHIYELKKGVRNMVLFTFNKRYETYARTRLEHSGISYIIQPVGGYDICAQCERYCERKERCNHDCKHCRCAQ